MARFGRKTSIPDSVAAAPAATVQPRAEETTGDATITVSRATASEAKDFIRDQVFMRVEPLVAVRISKQELMAFVTKLVAEIANDRKILLNQDEQHVLGANIVDEMVGLGPIEPLLRDSTVSDILVNGPRMIYVERRGKLELTKLQFRSDAHVLHVAQRIASSIGRRVDEIKSHAGRQIVGRQPRQCDHPASQPQRAVPFDPEVFEEHDGILELRDHRHPFAASRGLSRDRCALPPEYHHLRWNRFR